MYVFEFSNESTTQLYRKNKRLSNFDSHKSYILSKIAED